MNGSRFDILPNVYDSGGDTELMLSAVQVSKAEMFLDVGCGAGIVSVTLARCGALGIGVDINPSAVANARHNSELLGTPTAGFWESDVFDQVTGQFDLIVCNPPYTCHPATDCVEQMFWDPGHSMTRRFWEGVRLHLRPKGRIFFGWADFGDKDAELPNRLAKAAGFSLQRSWTKRMPSGRYQYLVHLFVSS